jgi:cell division protein FtsW
MNPIRRGTPDFILLFLTIALVGFGLVMVFSSSYSITYSEDPLFHTRKQAQFAILGLAVIFITMNTSYAKLKKGLIPFFLFSVVLLVLVLIIGVEVKGAKSWFRIGSFGGQPTEIAKIGVLAYLAVIISKKQEKIRDFKTGLMPILIVLSVVSGLILLQKDLGSTLVLIMASVIVLIVGGVRFKHLFYLGASGLIVVGTAVGLELLKASNGGQVSYRIKRLTSFLDPWAEPQGEGYHLLQSWYALGHGGVTGAGFGQSIQKLHYLPEAHNDFIFAVIGEELGFVGAAIFILIYLFFLWRALLVAIRCTDITGTLLGTGIVGLIATQALVNIGGVTGAIPITGVTLPFISYGGSSLLSTMFGVGILLCISRENSKLDKNKSDAASISA